MDVMTENKVMPKLRFGDFQDEWTSNSFGELLISSRLGGNYANSESPTENPLIKMGNLGRGNISINKVMYIEQGETLDNKDLIEYGDLFFNTRNTLDLVGKVAIWKNELSRAFYNSNLMYIKFDNNFFMNYRLNSFEGIKGLRRLATGTTSVAAVYTKDLLKLKLTVPSLPEQQKIASFLSSVDKKLQQLTKKKELLKKYKKGVMQKIFSEELRCKDEFGNNYPNWEEKKLGEELEHKSVRNKSNQVDLVLSVSNKKGFISQQEQFDGHQVASKDVTNYKVVNKGEYAYNPSRINVGSIARLDDFEKGIVSPMYVIFRLKNNLNSIFFDALYSSHRFKYLIKIGCSGSVRDSLNFDEMEKFDIKLPCIEEQQKIANFLSSLDSKIDLVSTQIENTKAFKKGLLQQMFV